MSEHIPMDFVNFEDNQITGGPVYEHLIEHEFVEKNLLTDEFSAANLLIKEINDEQRAKRAANARKYRAGLNKQQLAKKAEYARKLYAKSTEEQLARKSELHRIRLANLSDTERRRINDRRQQLRKMRKENARRLKAELIVDEDKSIYIDEQLEIHKDTKDGLKKENNTTEEQLVKRKEYYFNQNRILSEEQRLKRVEYWCNWDANINENNPKEKCKNRAKRKEKESLLDWLEYKDPLEALIEDMRQRNGNVDIIKSLDYNLLKEILQMLGNDYPQNILEQRGTMESVDFEIDVEYLILTLENWSGWTMHHAVKYLNTAEAYEDLLNYINNCFEDFQFHKEQSLSEEINNHCSPVFDMELSCSLKQLKTLFYQCPNNHSTYYNEKNLVSDLFSDCESPFTYCTLDWPFISTQMTLPGFSMKHENIHGYEYDLLNIKNARRLGSICQSLQLFYKLTKDKSQSDTFLPIFIKKFLKQLKDVVNTRTDIDIEPKKKDEILMVITQFENDISLCTNTLKTNTEYCLRLSPYPYVRYLGHCPDKDINITIEEQKCIDDLSLNVRLREIRHPKMSFNLEQFSVPFQIINGDIRFSLDGLFTKTFNTWISYKCVLCDENLGNSAPSYKISKHLYTYHGLEPDWECIKCFETFSNGHLIKHKWLHECI